MSKKHIRPIRVDGQLAYVTLTKGYVAVIDAADVPLVEGFNWCAKLDRKTVYAKRADYTGQQARMVLLHRVIMAEPNDLCVDHRDGDGLNNRRGNLRVASKSQNAQNQAAHRDNKSGFKGVSWHKRDAKWQAQIMLNGKNVWTKSFSSAEDAATARAQKVAELHGEFGRAS